MKPLFQIALWWLCGFLSSLYMCWMGHGIKRSCIFPFAVFMGAFGPIATLLMIVELWK